MKKILLCALLASLTACKSNDLRNIANSVSDIANISSSASGNSPTPSSSAIPTS